MKTQTRFIKDYLQKIKTISETIDVEQINTCLNIFKTVFENRRQIFIIGNGGSAATASHFVCDLEKMVLGKNFKKNQKRFRVICLSDNIPLMTALANDCSYDDIFSERLKTFAQKDDLLLVISGSGNSTNIIKAVKIGKKLKMQTLAFLGFDGGKVRGMVDSYVLIPSSEYGQVEDYHLILNHLITAYFLKENLDEKKSPIS